LQRVCTSRAIGNAGRVGTFERGDEGLGRGGRSEDLSVSRALTAYHWRRAPTRRNLSLLATSTHSMEPTPGRPRRASPAGGRPPFHDAGLPRAPRFDERGGACSGPRPCRDHPEKGIRNSPKDIASQRQ